jgi:DinB family protein
MLTRPAPDEFAAYYTTYTNQVGDGDIREIIEQQRESVLLLLHAISEQQSVQRYADDKWTIRQVLSHINDTERVFTFRAFWFARGFSAPLPGFDQNDGVANAGADERSWASHVAEFAAVRSATIALFRGLPEVAWTRRGIASDNPVSVRALAYITAGHVAHHVRLLREKYGVTR